MWLRGNLIFILVIFSALLLFANLGKRSLWEPDEGRYAEISREMVESGDWLTPRLNYIKHFDKPPLAYWLIGSSFKLFGLSEFSGRLPLAVLGLLGVLTIFYLGKKLFGRRTGFLSAIILASSLGYPAMSRVLSTDIIFSVFCLFCYLFFIRKSYFLFFLSLALGFMTKGPVIFIITVLPICVFVILTGKASIFKEISWGKGLLLFSLLALPWFIYEALLNKGLWADWIFQHTLHRIVRQADQPFYFFVPVLIGFFFPWIFFLTPAFKKYLPFKTLSSDKESEKMLLLFFWFIIPFLFFSLIGKKLVPYILPLLAPLAIITARLWDRALDNPKILSTKIFAASYYIFLFALGIIFVGMTVFLSLGFDHKFGIAAARENIIVMSIILLGSIIVSIYFFKSRKVMKLFWSITITSALFFLTAIDLLPKIEADISKSIKGLALKIGEDLKPQDKVVNFRCFLKSLTFYLGRRTIIVERERNIVYEESKDDWQDYVLKDKKELYKLLSKNDLRVFCITYTWEFEKIKEEYSRPVYFLGQAGKYVLFSNTQVKNKG